MPSSITMRSVLAACSILSLTPQALAHMEMSWPYPLHSKYDPENNYTNIDYSMTSPLSADGSNYPCKGYQNDRPIRTVVSYEAGETYNVTLAGSATHGGGSCQLSLSYDNGATFRVIKSMMGGCPLVSTYDFTIPSYAPSGTALLGWTWQNEQGNREFYMNCAEVAITGSTSSKRDTTTFESLPFIWKANLAGINDCVTVEGDDPVYPEPGPDVQYGGSITSSSAASSEAGVCDAATPFGQTYEYLDDTSEPQTATAGTGTAATATSSSTTTKKSSTTTTTKKSSTSTTVASTLSTAVKSSTTKSASTTTSLSTTATSTGASTTTSTCNASATAIIKKNKAHPKVFCNKWNAAKPHSTSPFAKLTVKQVNNACACILASASTSTTTCPSDVTLTVYASATTTAKSATVSGFATSGGSTVVVVSSATGSSGAASTGASDESYATGNLATYLPCVPGTYICTTDTTWVTCDQTMYSDGSTAWVYEYNRTVASGTECVPNISPYSSSTEQYAQQADTASGYYRDDRIASSQKYGTCSTAGEISCYNGSSEFLMCSNGAYVYMGAVASGTECVDNAIVSTSS